MRGGGRGEEPTLDGDQRRGGLPRAAGGTRRGEARTRRARGGAGSSATPRRRLRDARGGGEGSSGARARAIVTVQTTVEGRDVVFKRAEGRAARARERRAPRIQRTHLGPPCSCARYDERARARAMYTVPRADRGSEPDGRPRRAIGRQSFTDEVCLVVRRARDDAQYATSMRKFLMISSPPRRGFSSPSRGCLAVHLPRLHAHIFPRPPSLSPTLARAFLPPFPFALDSNLPERRPRPTRAERRSPPAPRTRRRGLSRRATPPPPPPPSSPRPTSVHPSRRDARRPACPSLEPRRETLERDARRGTDRPRRQCRRTGGTRAGARKSRRRGARRATPAGGAGREKNAHARTRSPRSGFALISAATARRRARRWSVPRKSSETRRRGRGVSRRTRARRARIAGGRAPRAIAW